MLIGVGMICRQSALLFLVRFVMKTDDDAFVNMFSLISLLQEVATNLDVTSRPPTSSSSSSNMLLMCNAWPTSLVDRVGKWGINRTTWRYDHWPTFCQGIAFIMTMNFIASAYQLVHRVPHIWLDDVRPVSIIYSTSPVVA